MAIAAARALERDEVAAAETIIAESVRRLSGERLAVAQIADLVGMPATDVRRILRAESNTLGAAPEQ